MAIANFLLRYSIAVGYSAAVYIASNYLVKLLGQKD